MFEMIFLLVLGLVWIIFATVQDLKTREVANWLNFSLIIFALGFRFFYSLFSDAGFDFFYQGLIGLGIFFILGNFLYYSRVFAGGDAKLMIALGAVLPLGGNFLVNVKVFLWFFGIFLFTGTVYGIIISGFLATRNFEKFKKEFLMQFKKTRKLVLIILFFGLIIMAFGFFESLFFVLGILIFILPYLFLFGKSIEETCMVKKISVKNLREGDWLYKNLKIGKKEIKSNWEGLTKEEIWKIKKHYKEVLIKQGIAFVPVFLISFLVLIGVNYLGYPLW